MYVHVLFLVLNPSVNLQNFYQCWAIQILWLLNRWSERRISNIFSQFLISQVTGTRFECGCSSDLSVVLNVVVSNHVAVN